MFTIKKDIRKKILKLTGLLLLAMVGLSLSNASDAAARCGVHTANSGSFAGLIVESYWWPYTGGTLVSNNNQVRVWAPYDPRPDNDPGNIVDLGNDNRYSRGELRVDDATFLQYNSGCGDGRNVVLGYDETSVRSDGRAGSWALDCDAHAGPQWGVGNERWFKITGVGVPTGARAGGTWEVKDFQAKNGFTGHVTIAYREPAPPDYNLTPVVSATNPSKTVSQGSVINFRHSVTKTGNAPATRSTLVVVKQYTIPPSGSFNQTIGVQDRVPNNCDPRYNSGGVCAVDLYSQSRTFSSSSTSISVPSQFANISTNNMDAGTLVCQILAIAPPTHTNRASPDNRWSAPYCVRVGKKPTVQIRGADAWAGGNFRNASQVCATSTSTGFNGSTASINNRVYGSWSEYGLFSTGPANSFGSSAVANSRSSLFRNTPTNSLGYWYGNPVSGQRCMTDFSSMFGPGENNNAATIELDSNTKSGVIRATHAGTITIRANNDIRKGKTVIIKTSAAQRVVIAGTKLAYEPGPYASLEEIPRVIIIGGGDVVVSSNVTQVDAWIQARGTLYTCDTRGDSAGRLTINDCDKQLTFNGPVTANRLSLRRTAGAEASNPGAPAEIFNLRPDAFLSAYSGASMDSSFETVYQTELPPRY